MKTSLIRSTLTVAALLLSASLVLAVDATPLTPDAKGAAKATVDSAKATTATAKSSAKSTTAKAKAAADARIDINTATEAELKAVPEIGDTYASKIIAGRPYANKAQLKSRDVIPAPVYAKVKDLVVARKK